MDRDALAPWLRLLETPGLGRDGARRLVAAFGTPEGVLQAPAEALTACVGPVLAAALAEAPARWAERVDGVLAWLEAGAARRVMSLGDPDYPPLLLQTADPPLLLYVQGRVELLAAPAVAVVGSRQASAQGLDNAREFSRQLAEAGLVVVSGLAAGIDGAAHQGALAAGPQAAGTVAVVGTGLDRVYPPSHRALAHQIAEAGALLSEYPPGTPPLPEHFPQRNRIIAGLTLGTLVVEAALRSGSLITARMAAEAGRDVFAIPGSIHAAQSRGCHALIKQGAQLAETVDDILDALQSQRPGPAPGLFDAPADPLLSALGTDPVTLDALLARTGLPAADLSARLLDLELEGQVARLPGGLYQRRLAG